MHITGQNGELIILAKRANAFIFLTVFDRRVESSAAFFLFLEDASGEKYDYQQETGTC